MLGPDRPYYGGHRVNRALRDKLVTIGATVVSHAGYVMFQMAEVAIPRDLFARILRRIQRLGPPLPRPT